jgi:2-iminobutanoate/2-iminopropanoate deaminase
MDKKEIRTQNAPLPVGPYSQAVRTGNMLFVSGVLPMDPQTKVTATNDITVAAKTIFSNIDAVLKEAGVTRDNVVKTTIFMTDLKYFADVNKIYGEFFADCKVMPARSTIQVSALPLGVPLEIELIAICS